MALAPVFCTGFESGLVPSTNILLGWDSTAGSTISVGNSTTRNVRNGTYACRINRAASAATSLRRTVGITGVYGRAVCRFAFNVVTLPSSGKAVIAFYISGTGGSWNIRVSSTGVITLEDQTGANVATLGTVTTGTWHYVDINAAVQSGTWDGAARMDGGTTQSLTQAGAAGGTVGGFAIGTYATTEAATVIDYDDILVGGSGLASQAEGFWGDGAVEAYHPASDGTHSFTTGDFGIGDAGATQAPSWTTAFQNVDDDPWSATRSTTDAIGQRVIRTTGYVEIKPEQKATHGSRVANCVSTHLLYSASASQTNTAGTIIMGTGQSAGIWGDLPVAQGGNGGALANYGGTAQTSKSIASFTITNPWTDTEVNAIKWRFGGAGDISPVPTLQAVMLEVDWPAVTGTAFTATPADAAGVTDALSIIQGYGVAPADGAGITDVVDRLWTAQIFPPDNAAITDAVTPAQGMVPAPLADAAGLTDTIAAGLAFSIAPPDSAGITDALASSAGVVTNLADGAGITDALARLWAVVLSPGDAAGITDAVSTGLAYVSAIADIAGITDAQATAQGFTLPLADAAGVTDAYATVAAYVRAIADPAGITDATGVGYGIGIVDAGALTDALTSLATMVQTIADAAAITDSAAVQGSGAITQNITDIAGVTDALTTAAALVRTVSDPVAASDALAMGQAASVADTAAMTDVAVPALGRVVLVADAAGIADSTGSFVGQLAAVADSAGITDVEFHVAGHMEDVADAAGITDALDFESNYVMLVSDTMAIADTIAFVAEYLLEIDDVAALTDSTQPVLVAGGPTKSLAVYLSSEAITLVELDAEHITLIEVSAGYITRVELDDELMSDVMLSAESVVKLEVE